MIVKLKIFLKYVINYIKYQNINRKTKINIIGTEETLCQLGNNGSIIRFGDGEFQLINGQGIEFQKYDEQLAERLQEILKCEHPGRDQLISIPFELISLRGYTYKSRCFWCDYWAKNAKNIIPHLNLDLNYFDSQVTRIFINRKRKGDFLLYLQQWKRIWNDKRILIVEGEKSRFGVGNDLLSNAAQIERILCPATDAFGFYDEILREIKKHYSDQLIFCVLGPTATVLSYDLSFQGIRCLDMGNLDMEYEWYQMNAKEQCKVKGKYTFESSDGKLVEECNNESYIKQIIGRVGC